MFYFILQHIRAFDQSFVCLFDCLTVQPFCLFLSIKSIIAIKRNASYASGLFAKRQCTKYGVQDLREATPTNAKSICEQAEPYRLSTARFPLEALTSSWSVGSNRTVDIKHVQDLCRIFEESGVQRECAENHLRVACTEAAVQKMVDHIRSSASRAGRLADTTYLLCER